MATLTYRLTKLVEQSRALRQVGKPRVQKRVTPKRKPRVIPKPTRRPRGNPRQRRRRR